MQREDEKIDRSNAYQINKHTKRHEKHIHQFSPFLSEVTTMLNWTDKTHGNKTRDKIQLCKKHKATKHKNKISTTALERLIV